MKAFFKQTNVIMMVLIAILSIKPILAIQDDRNFSQDKVTRKYRASFDAASSSSNAALAKQEMQSESVQHVLSYTFMRCTKSLLLGAFVGRGVEFLLQGDPLGVILVAGPIAYEMYLDWKDYGKPSNYLNIIPFPLGTLITFSLQHS